MIERAWFSIAWALRKPVTKIDRISCSLIMVLLVACEPVLIRTEPECPKPVPLCPPDDQAGSQPSLRPRREQVRVPLVCGLTSHHWFHPETGTSIRHDHRPQDKE